MENPPAKDTAGALSPRERAEKLIVAVANPLIERGLSATNQEIGKQFALLISKLDQLSAQIDTLRTEKDELKQNLIDLHREYDEVRKYAHAASDSAASAKADNRYLGRTVERTNLMSEIVVILIDTLILPFHEWAGMLVKKRYELDPRSSEDTFLGGSTTFIERRKRS